MAEPTLTEADREIMRRSAQIMEQSAKMDAPDWLRTYDPEAPVEKTDKGIRRWLPVAQQIADTSNDSVKAAIKKAYGVVEDQNIRMLDNSVRADSPLLPGEELYYFISFSQPESEIKEIMQAAAEVDARVILRGMRPGDRMVNQTAAAMWKLGKGMNPVPKVAIDSRLFKVFNVNEAPAMVYRKSDRFISVKGVASVNWFLTKAREAENSKSLGVVSTTHEIAERDVIEEIQSRVAAVDWDAKRRAAMNRYIKKLPEFNLPTATKDAVYKIDPRIQFRKDITANDGTLLAAKGQVVNPMEYFPGRNLTLYAFDGMSDKQKAVIKEQMRNAKGEIGLMTSRIDKEEGFEFISELRKEFGMPVYMLQERMISRFQLRYLPAEVQLGNGEITVKEFGIRQQEDALINEKEQQSKTESKTHTEE